MRLLIKNILSNGCVLGNVKKMNTTGEYVKANSSKELKRFYEARDITIKQIQELKKENKDMIDYLTIQELMVLDPNLEIEVKAFISEKMSAVDAVKKSMEKYKAGLSNSSSTYLQERILDIVNQILNVSLILRVWKNLIVLLLLVQVVFQSVFLVWKIVLKDVLMLKILMNILIV